MATFNGAEFVAEQLDSILRSSVIDEVLVSDDGSTDGTIAILEGQVDPRVRLLRGPREGVTRNYEYLLTQTGGDIVFLSDQDDVWLPTKVDEMLQVLERGVDLAVSDCHVVSADLTLLQSSYFAINRSGPGLIRNLVRNSYLGCCMAFRRTLLDRALPFPRNSPAHDWWLGMIAEIFGSVEFSSSAQLLYRRHGGNASSAAGRSRASLTDRLRRRAWLVRCLLDRRQELRARND